VGAIVQAYSHVASVVPPVELVPAEPGLDDQAG
jgi:hypothetical protein